MNTIEVTEEQYAAHLAGESITIEPKVKPWEPQAALSSYGLKVYGADSRAMSDASRKATSYIKLLAYVEAFGGDWVADWDDVNQAKGYVYYDCSYRSWLAGVRYANKALAYVDMSRACAEGLADKLNSGEVRL
jgi:hypothetical protein